MLLPTDRFTVCGFVVSSQQISFVVFNTLFMDGEERNTEVLEEGTVTAREPQVGEKRALPPAEVAPSGRKTRGRPPSVPEKGPHLALWHYSCVGGSNLIEKVDRQSFYASIEYSRKPTVPNKPDQPPASLSPTISIRPGQAEDRVDQERLIPVLLRHMAHLPNVF